MTSERELPETYCYFYAEGFDFDPDRITELLQITPTEIRRRGEAGYSGMPVRSNTWKVNDDAPRKDPFFEQHLESILLKLEPKADVIRSLEHKCAIGVNCVGYFPGCNPGFDINPDLLARLAALRIAIGFDLYALGDDSN